MRTSKLKRNIREKIEVLRKLQELGVDFTEADTDGATPVYVASEHGQARTSLQALTPGTAGSPPVFVEIYQIVIVRWFSICRGCSK